MHVHTDINIRTGWRRLIASPKLYIFFHQRATKYRTLLRKMTCKDKGSYESSPPCTKYSSESNLGRSVAFLEHCFNIYIYIYKCVYILIYIPVEHIYIHVLVHIYICFYVCIYKCIYVYSHTHMCLYIHAYVYIYMYIYYTLE